MRMRSPPPEGVWLDPELLALPPQYPQLQGIVHHSLHLLLPLALRAPPPCLPAQERGLLAPALAPSAAALVLLLASSVSSKPPPC